MSVRHDALADEMLKRGYNHKSPYDQPDISYLPDEDRLGEVDISISLYDLCSRCEDCKKRIRS